jgi:LysM repeat protein
MMLRRLIILLMCLFMGAAFAAAQETPGVMVDVGESDTLVSIAERTGTTVDCLRTANGLAVDATLEGLSRLFVPDACAAVESAGDQGGGATTTTVTPLSDQSYVVQSGDRLTKIAQQFGVTVQCIVDSNAIADPDLIYPGQVLLMTTACQGGGGGATTTTTTASATTEPALACRFDHNAGRSAPGNLYTVQSGDLLDFIACDFNVDLTCLLASNPEITHRSRIAVGQVLVINRACPIWTDATRPR